MSDPTQASELSRRKLLQTALAALPLAAIPLTALPRLARAEGEASGSLEEFSHAQVRITGDLQTAQRENVLAVLLALDEDSLLFPFRHMSGQATPGTSLGGWYEYLPNYDHHHDAGGLAPGHCLGQWISAMARLYAASSFQPGDTQVALKTRVERLTALLTQSVTPAYFAKTRFPGYTLDKLICASVDAQQYTGDANALPLLDLAIASADSSLPGHAIEREVQWKLGYDISWTWDENYTLPENLYRAGDLARRASPARAHAYRQMADAYLFDTTFFEPLSHGENALSDLHAYSHVNCLCSAARCFLSTGSQMHLDAARNGFAMLEAQSYATGGWGPDETLRKPGTADLFNSLVNTHNSFETPCGAYAHMKLTRYLLCATRDGRYGDSMERIFFNTILGVLPLQSTGRSFYHSDYSFNARRVYSTVVWPCCAGTLPQAVADYGINSYLQAPGELWVNLYQPSQLRAEIAGRPVLLAQTTNYPFEPEIHVAVEPSRPTTFTLRLRIPAYVEAPSLCINGNPQAVSVQEGFCAIKRTWRAGDQVTLTLPLSLRLESLPVNGGANHPNLVALLYGPLVLFAVHESEMRTPAPVASLPYSQPPAPQPAPISVAREALLAATRKSQREWTVLTPDRTLRLLPFTELADNPYTTYLSVV